MVTHCRQNELCFDCSHGEIRKVKQIILAQLFTDSERQMTALSTELNIAYKSRLVEIAQLKNMYK